MQVRDKWSDKCDSWLAIRLPHIIRPDLRAHNYAGFGQGLDVMKNALALSGSTPYPVLGAGKPGLPGPGGAPSGWLRASSNLEEEKHDTLE